MEATKSVLYIGQTSQVQPEVTHILAAPINAQGSQMLTVETARWKVEKWLFNVGLMLV